MYRVIADNGMVIECDTVEECRALLGENAASTVAVERTTKKREPRASKQAMGSGPKRKWAIAEWYGNEGLSKNDAWLKLGAMRKEEPVKYAQLEEEFDGKRKAPRGKRTKASA